MPTITPVFIEFRCTRCWYSNCADAENTGNEVECRNCGQKLEVPEATADRIERALALLEAEPELRAPKNDVQKSTSDFDRTYSDQEMREIARQKSYVPASEMNFGGYALASPWARLFASIIDNLLVGLSGLVGFLVLIWLSKQGFAIEDPMVTLGSDDELAITTMLYLSVAPLLVMLTQWYLLATAGQTLGKKMLFMRIVTDDGQLPGFIRAVLVRNWVRGFLCAIPFFGGVFGLLDVLFIFSGSRKCLHDHLAGTRVVSLI